MTTRAGRTGAEPFFLKSGAGQRFCLFHPPAGACRGAVLYVHPFAEEMNRSRRMAAQQARALAALGYGVLQLDLLGCGDSSGDFGDARWEAWRQDLADGAAWLRQRLDRPLTLWGLRLGALLALDYARSASDPVHRLLLWQPVLNGATHLTQFLRLRTAHAMLDGGTAAQTGTDASRLTLRAGDQVEVAGYTLDPALAAALDALDTAEAMAPSCRVDWFEALGTSAQTLPAGAARVSSAWQAGGVDLHLHPLPCPPFWTTPEITECPAWLEATSGVMQGDR